MTALRMMLRMLMVTGLCLAALPPMSHAQGAGKKDEPANAGGRQTQPPERAQPSLDELLGIPQAKPGAPEQPGQAGPEAPDPSRTALERRLTATEASQEFEQAVQLMGDTAQRLKVSRDTGIETQRLQDEIIRKLDMLIQMAEQQQQQQQQRSQSRSQSERSQQPAQPQPAPAGAQGDPDQSQSLPMGEDPSLNPDIAARGAAWGSLPERARDALLQGNADTYSSMYRRWTEAYYRRLAEERNR